VFLDNIVLHARARLLLSWALPDACAPGRGTHYEKSALSCLYVSNVSRALTFSECFPGHGHLNCRTNLYVVRALFLRGFALHEDDTRWAREQVRGSAAYWFEGTLLVFDSLDLREISLATLEAQGTGNPTRQGARAYLRQHSRGPQEEEAGLKGCKVQVHEPRAGSTFEVDPGDAIDVAMDIALDACPQTQRSMVNFTTRFATHLT